jgi:hypothetical protein
LETVDKCEASFKFPANESFILSSQPCTGGFSWYDSVPAGTLSLVHTNDNANCGADLSQSFTNLGTANGQCIPFHTTWMKIQPISNSTGYSLWFNCSNSTCSNCGLMNASITLNQCLTGPSLGLPGSVRVTTTQSLTFCPDPNGAAAAAMAAAIIAGIVVGSVVGFVLIVLAVG